MTEERLTKRQIMALGTPIPPYCLDCRIIMKPVIQGNELDGILYKCPECEEEFCV